MNITVKQIEYKSSATGNTIFGWIYIPAEPACAAVQIVHGMSEHMERYHELMRFLAQNGYVACGIDQLGHGRSAPDEEHLGFFAEQDGWKRLIDDQHKFARIVHAEAPGLRTVLLGHSMGSFVSRIYASKYSQQLEGLVLCGTGRGDPRLGFALAAARRSIRKNGPLYRDRSLHKLVFGHYNDRFQPVRTGGEWLSRDEASVMRYSDDARCGFTFTAAGFHDLFMLVRESNSAACFESVRKDLPVLILSGAMDPVGEFGKGPQTVCRRYHKAGLENVQIKLYEGARHEILGELNRGQVWSDLLTWLRPF